MRRIIPAVSALAFSFGASAAIAADWTPLASPADVAAEEAAFILDIREAPEAVPAGAVHAPLPLWRGPEANPGELLSDEALGELLSSLGLTTDRNVALVHEGGDPDSFAAAARVYWTLKSAGFENLAIIEGGAKGWAAAGLPLAATTSAPAATVVEVSFSDEWLADWETVEEVQAGDDPSVLLDARPTAFLTGEFRHPFATSGGTLEGAAQLNHRDWFDAEGRFAPDAAKVEAARASLSDGAVVFCNTGLWGATNWFVLSELGGAENVKLYAESIVGWTAFGGETVLAGEPPVVN